MCDRAVMNQEKKEKAFLAFENGASIDETRAILECGRNKAIKLLKEYFGPEKYSEIAKRLIIWRRIEAFRKTNKGRKCPPRNKEWCENISKGKKGKPMSEEHKLSISKTLKERVKSEGFWLSEEKIFENAQKARQTKIKNGTYEKWSKTIHPYRCQPISKSGRHNMSVAKKKFYARGGINHRKGIPHTEETKKRISEITKSMWEEGAFDNGNGLWRSKLEIKVFERLSKLYDCVHSYRVGSKIFDIYIKELNLLIEVNGDYWHFNPVHYDACHYDTHRKVFVSDVWARDEEKKNLAESRRFRVCALWELDLNTDFEGTLDKHVK